jgi:hypothetical protein
MPTQIPSFCPHCGLIFPSRAFNFGGNVTNLVLTGNRETCPRCGQMAELPDGTFNVVDDTIEVLQATPLTRARLSDLANVLDRARRGAIADEDLADAVEREGNSSGVADLIRKTPPKMRHALILLLIFVIQTIAAHELDQALSDAPTQAQVKHDLATLSEQLRGDDRPIQASEIEKAVLRALDAYDRERERLP